MILKNVTNLKEVTLLNTSTAYTEYNGVDEEVLLPLGSNLFLPVPFTQATWSVWFKSTAITGLIFGQYDGGSTSAAPIINLNSSGKLYFYCDATTAAGVASRRESSIVVNDGNWHNVVCVYKGAANQDIYIDGVLRNGGFQNIIEASVTSISVNNKIGFDSFAGSIDEVAIWNRNLSASEVLAIYNQERIHPNYSAIPNLIAQYRMDRLNPTDIIGGKNGVSANMDQFNIIQN